MNSDKLGRLIALSVLVVLILLMLGYAAFANELPEQTTFQKPDFNVITNNNFDENLAPANLAGNHYLNKCDSDAVKKRAHRWGFMGYQKQLDVQMQTALLNTCEKLAQTDPAQAVACIREFGDQQREQRKDAANGITNGINASSLGLQVINGFIRKR
jgi:hypothetical protein